MKKTHPVFICSGITCHDSTKSLEGASDPHHSHSDTSMKKLVDRRNPFQSALRCGAATMVLLALSVFSVDAAGISFVGVEPSTGPAFATQNWSSTNAAKSFDLGGSEVYGTAGYYQIRPMPTNTVSNISEGVGAGNNLGVTATNNPTLYSAPVFLSSITGGAGTYVNFGGYPNFLGPDGTTIYRQGSLSVSVGNGPFNTPSGANTGYFGEAFSFTLGPNMGADFRIGIAVDTAGTGLYAPDYVSIFNSGTGSVFSSLLTRNASPEMTLFDISASAGESFSAAMWQLAGTQSVSPFALITFDVSRYNFDVGSGLSQTNSVSLNGAAAGVLETGAGTLVMASSNSAAGGALVSDGTLVIASGAVVGGNITNNSTLVFDGAHGGVANAVSGTGSLVKSGTGIATFYASNSYTGATVVSGGQLMLGGAGAIPTGSAVEIAAGASINLTGFFAPTNINRTIGGLTGAGVLFGSGGTVTVNKASGSDTFSGDIQGGQGLIKSGSGTLVLSGANSYTGGTTVSAGALIVNGSTAGGALAVSSGATLGGSGTVGGATTISGIHSPGNSPGIQTFTDGLTYANGSTFLWELSGNTATGRGTSFDGVNVTGGTLTINTGVTSSLIFNGHGSTVLWSDGFWDSNQTWLVFDNANAPSILGSPAITIGFDSLGNDFAVARAGSSFEWDVVGNDIYLNYAIPEPSTYALLALSAAGLGGYVLRRRRK